MHNKYDKNTKTKHRKTHLLYHSDLIILKKEKKDQNVLFALGNNKKIYISFLKSCLNAFYL